MRILLCDSRVVLSGFINQEYILLLNERNRFHKYYVRLYNSPSTAKWRLTKSSFDNVFNANEWKSYKITELTQDELFAELL